MARRRWAACHRVSFYLAAWVRLQPMRKLTLSTVRRLSPVETLRLICTFLSGRVTSGPLPDGRGEFSVRQAQPLGQEPALALLIPQAFAKKQQMRIHPVPQLVENVKNTVWGEYAETEDHFIEGQRSIAECFLTPLLRTWLIWRCGLRRLP